MYKIKLNNVRLSYPNLFQTASFGGEDLGKYDATFILDKKTHAKEIKKIQAMFQELADEKLKGTVPNDDKLCLKDGDETDKDELQGKYSVKASTKKRPTIINRDRTPIAEDDNIIFAGCYVVAILSFWAQNNQFGKRINGTIEGVQFFKKGDPFGEPPIDIEEFDVFDDDDDEDDKF